MKKTHLIWMRIACLLQFLTGALHSLSLFVKPEAEDETQKQLFGLMETYKFDMGSGFMCTMAGLLTGLSSCYSLLLVFAGLTGWFMLRHKPGADMMKGMLNIHIFIFAICFALMAVFTFLPPIILTGMILLSLIIARFSFPKV